MIMQFLSVFFGSLTLWALFYDYVIHGGNVVLLAGEVWYVLSPSSINLVQAVIERYVWAPLWADVFLPILQMPFWLFCGALTIIFLLFWSVGSRRKNYY